MESTYTLLFCVLKNAHNKSKGRESKDDSRCWAREAGGMGFRLLLQAKPGRGTYLRVCAHEFSLGNVKFERSVRPSHDDAK